MKTLIKKLTNVYGLCGHEENVRQIIEAEVTPYVDSVEVDALGNLHAVKNGSGDGARIMLAAHMDEIGLMVTKIEKEGYLRFTNVGYLYPRNLVSSRVMFENGSLGMINMELGETTPEGTPLFKNLYIDVGAASRKDCPIKVGDIAGFVGPAVILGNRVMAKSLDDRIGCAVQIEVIKQLKETPHEVHFVFTVQEEVGVRGAITSAFKVDPDIAIALDITVSGDEPGKKYSQVKLGDGVAIKIMDTGNITHPTVKNWMIETAQANEIPHQLEVLVGGGTDAMAIQKTRSGVAVGTLSIPCRHVHSPSEIIDLRDAEATVQLLTAMLTQPAPQSLS